MNNKVIGLTMSMILLFTVVGCTGQSLQQVNQSVTLAGAEQVEAHIEMGVGELNLSNQLIDRWCD